jgi:hypothetical protein
MAANCVIAVSNIPSYLLSFVWKVECQKKQRKALKKVERIPS